MILGLDISTVAIGIAVLDNEQIVVTEVLKLNSDLTLEQRAVIFEDKMKEIYDLYSIDQIFIEKPIVLFKGGSHALTVALLQTFNGMCRFVTYKTFNKIPILISATSARSCLGIKIVKGRKKKKDKKQPIIDYVVDRYKNTSTPFLYKLTPKGNFAPTTDDRADSIVLALSGPKIS